jgi:hypothetical protein
MTVIAKRIYFRLEPARIDGAALARVMRLAKAFNAELAARMIADTRLATAVAVSGHNIDRELHRSELQLRREVAGLGAREHTSWTFEVVHCAGILARECGMASEDLVAIELPKIETSLSDLREEISTALTLAHGVVLLPATMQTGNGPVVTVVDRREHAKALIGQSDAIAQALGTALRIVERDQRSARGGERGEPSDVATRVRRLNPLLVVVDAEDPMVKALLARPRFVREFATPLLLLKST